MWPGLLWLNSVGVWSQRLSLYGGSENWIPALSSDVDAFVLAQRAASTKRLVANIEPNGAVAASPSRVDPNYAYHWVRDAATTMREVVSQFSHCSPCNASLYSQLELLLWQNAAFEKGIQNRPNPSDALGARLGEPKFNLDGSAFNEPWGRPQNDGPALRAATHSAFALAFLDQGGNVDRVITDLYAPEVPARSLIKADLEYVAHSWESAQSVELWEEVRGTHYHTRIVQAAALFSGARIASRLNDPFAARFYNATAHTILDALQSHWNQTGGYISASLDVASGPPSKTSYLDVSVLLGALHVRHDLPAGITRGLHSWDGPHVLLTALQLAKRMRELYGINAVVSDSQSRLLAPAIGRYTEDTYDGYSTDSRGNPWFLATLAYAEYAFALTEVWCREGRWGSIQFRDEATASLMARALHWVVQGGLLGEPEPHGFSPEFPSNMTGWSYRESPRFFASVIGNLTLAGDAFVRRVMQHVPQRDVGMSGHRLGSLSEQFNRDTGFMQGAEELTWSHASFLGMARQRNAALGICNSVNSK
ncbi:Six-hairpin glycosidase-like protein, partial [Chytriomyces sp. MP71]